MLKSYTYYLGAILLPVVTFAHDGEEDGHAEVVSAPVDTDERKMVAIGVIVVVAVIIGVMVWMKRKQ